MFTETINKFKFYLENIIDKYFPNLRWAALMIILPAVFIVPIYFFSNLSEVFARPEPDYVVAYENRFAPLKKDLPANAVVNYISDQKQLKDFIIASYILVPARLVRGLEPKQNKLVVHNLDTAEIPNFEGFAMEKNYGNGIMLFRRTP